APCRSDRAVPEGAAMTPLLRHRVTLQSASATADEGGGRALAWSDVATVWARIEQRGGEEVLRAGEIEPQTAYRLTIRPRAGLVAGMRAVWRGKAIEITGVADPDGRGLALALDGICRSEVS